MSKGHQKQTSKAKKKGKINILIDDWSLVGFLLLFFILLGWGVSLKASCVG